MPKRNEHSGKSSSATASENWPVPKADSEGEFLKNAKLVWRQQRPDSVSRRGRPSEVGIVFLACYDSTRNWNGRFTLGRLREAVGKRLEKFKIETVNDRYSFVVPHIDTIDKHIKIWLLWRSGFTAKDWDVARNRKTLSRFKINGPISKEYKEALNFTKGVGHHVPSGYITFLSSRGMLRSPSDYDRQNRPDFAAWIDDQTRLTDMVRKLVEQLCLVR